MKSYRCEMKIIFSLIAFFIMICGGGCFDYQEHTITITENYHKIDKTEFLYDLQDFAYENNLRYSVSQVQQKDRQQVTTEVNMQSKTFVNFVFCINVTDGIIEFINWGSVNNNIYLNNLKKILEKYKIQYEEKFSSMYRLKFT